MSFLFPAIHSYNEFNHDSQKRYIRVLTPCIFDYDFIWKGLHCSNQVNRVTHNPILSYPI